MSSTRATCRFRLSVSKQRPRNCTRTSTVSPAVQKRCLETLTYSRTPDPVSFTHSYPRGNPQGDKEDHRKNDERTLKLGVTLRTLQPLLPTLLQSPLPTAILSPNIKLHLFPSTHPHLPVVQGRVAYIAALWTSPLAWGRVPLIGNVKLEILSERMIHSPSPYGYPSGTSRDSDKAEKNDDANSSPATYEQLVVRWRTIGSGGTGALGRSARNALQASKPLRTVQETQERGAPVSNISEEDDEFTGLFIFEFDEEGRICRHVIEHVEEGGNWEKKFGPRVIGLTEWLLGGRNSAPEGGAIAPCFSRN